MCNDIVDACIFASKKCIPSKIVQNKSKTKAVPGWNDNVKTVRDTALFWHSLWKDNECPSAGVIHDVRAYTRRNYHQAVKRNKKDKERISNAKLAKYSLKKGNKEFWNEVKRRQGKKSAHPSSMDGVTDSEEICETFALKYEELFNSVRSSPQEISDVVNRIDNEVDALCCNGKCGSLHTFTSHDIRESIRCLKPNKQDGYTSCSSNHLRNGTDKLSDYITLLFNCMLNHGTSPESMLISTIVPIPKDRRKSLNKAENYRGISLGSILCKVFEILVNNKQRTFLHTCDLQFGGKNHHSTSQCSFVLSEVVNYYTSRNSEVHLLFLDASKAFDRVNFYKLFNILLDRGMCPLIIRFMLNCYTNQKLRVQWNSNYSRFFEASNGVKQGSILSPILFGIYMDELLKQLEESSVGCYIGNSFCGAAGYVDDIAILAPTKCSLKKMYSICNEFSLRFDVKFNPSKSFYMLFGNNDNSVHSITVGDCTLVACMKVRYLGNSFSYPTPSCRIAGDIKCDFVRRFNTVNAIFGNVHPDIKYKLFRTYCLSMYGCVLLDFSQEKEVNGLLTAWRKAVRKLLGLHPRAHSILLPHVINDKPLEVMLHSRFLKFMWNGLHSHNKLVYLCSKLALLGSGSSAAQSLNHISATYRFDKFDLKKHVPVLIYKAPPVSVQRNAGAIKDLLVLKYQGSDFTISEVNELLDYFSLS